MGQIGNGESHLWSVNIKLQLIHFGLDFHKPRSNFLVDLITCSSRLLAVFFSLFFLSHTISEHNIILYQYELVFNK